MSPMFLKTVSFDKSISTFVQKRQMDLLIHFWDREADSKAISKGQSIAEWVFKTFVKGVIELDKSKLL